MRELTAQEIDAVSGGFNDWQNGGIAVMAFGISGGLVTAVFGLPIGGSMLAIGTVIALSEH